MTSVTCTGPKALDGCEAESVDVHASEVSTDGPGGREQDGTLEWDSTTRVLVRVHAAGRTGLGYTYGAVSTASFARSVPAPVVQGGPVSAHAFCAVRRLRHLDYLHDHVRVERLLFDGTLSPEEGALRPDTGRPGLGLEVRWADAEPYRVHGTRPA